MSLDEGSDDILVKGIMFWMRTIETLHIKDENSCDELLEQLQQHLSILVPETNGNIHLSGEKDRTFKMILALGFKFWMKTVEEQNIKYLSQCDMIINYLEGFLSDIELNITPTIQDSPNIIKFVKAELPDIKPKRELKTEDDEDYSFINDIGGPDNSYDDADDDDQIGLSRRLSKIDNLNKEVDGENLSFADNLKLYSNVKDFMVKGERINCKYCPKSFKSIKCLGTHVGVNHTEKKEKFEAKFRIFKCLTLECKSAFYNKKQLRKHLSETHDYTQRPGKKGSELQTHTCEICNKSFSKRKNLYKHKQRHNKKDEGESLCSECGRYFDSLKEMKKHKRRMHRKPGSGLKVKIEDLPPSSTLICPDCGDVIKKRDKGNAHLTYHQFKVHGIGGVCCEQCGKKFFSKAALEKHRVVHISVATLACDVCGKMFKDKNRLDIHIQSQHSLDEDRKFQCNQCVKGFMSRQVYDGHMNMHLGLKPHKCEQCGEGFQNHSNLAAHIRRTHLNIKRKSQWIKKTTSMIIE